MRNESYRLATYAGPDGVARAGIVVDHEIVDVGQDHAGVPRSVMSILEDWEQLGPTLRLLARDIRAGAVSARSPLSSVKLLAPVLYPGTIFCAGANYKDHVAEMSKALKLPEEPDPHTLALKPWHLLKHSKPCVRATDTTIPLPSYSKRVDWEAEIAIVIGRECRNVSVERAMEYVAGVSIVNDLS